MPNLKLFDPANLAQRYPSQASIQSFTTAELKDELLRRGNVDFSKIELWVKLSPFILLLGMGFVWKIKSSIDGASLWCLL